jgi:hypothetical protein
MRKKCVVVVVVVVVVVAQREERSLIAYHTLRLNKAYCGTCWYGDGGWGEVVPVRNGFK